MLVTDFVLWTQYFLSCRRKKNTSTFGLLSKLNNFEKWVIEFVFSKLSLISKSQFSFANFLQFRKRLFRNFQVFDILSKFRKYLSFEILVLSQILDFFRNLKFFANTKVSQTSLHQSFAIQVCASFRD